MLLNQLTDQYSAPLATAPQPATPDPTSTATPTLQKPKAPLAPTTPTDLTGALPIATQPAGAPAPAPTPAPAAPTAPLSPPPLATSDPLAFATGAPSSPAPYTAPGGQTFVGGTQTTDPATGAVTNPGVVGQQFVPGSNGGLVDLGGGNFAPTPGSDPSKGYFFGGPSSILTANGANPTQDQSLMAGLYGTSGYDPARAGFAAVYQGPTGDLIFAAPGFNPAQLPDGAKLISGNGPTPTAPAGGASGASGTLIPANRPMLTSGAGPTPGAANTDPLGGIGLTLPASSTGAASAPPAGGTPGASSTVAPGVQGYQTTPDNALTNQTLLPSNDINRVQLAQNALQSTLDNVLNPAFQADQRDLNRYNFGAGRGVSGTARTSQGDILSDYERTKANLANNLLTNATEGSIGDLYRNLDYALREQGFQAGQQGQAFNQNLSLQGLADQEQQQSFGQALQQLLAGSSGNPANVALILSQIFGGQAGQAGQAASNLAASQQQQQNASSETQQLQDYINSIQMGNIAGGINTLPPYLTPSVGDYGDYQNYLR